MNIKYFVCFVLCVVVNTIAASPTISFEDDFDNSIDLSVLGPEIYGQPDPKAGEQLANWNPSINSSNAEEQGTYAEGDILFEIPKGRFNVKRRSSRWCKGIVPYEISSSFSTSDKAQINAAIAAFTSQTIIKFVAHTTEDDYLVFTNTESGCYSSIGRVGGRQTLNLQSPGCLTKVGSIIHLIMHALGFLHENARRDRDDYITVHFENVLNALKKKFSRVRRDYAVHYHKKYDWDSIMHYSATAFSKNGQNTIVPIGYNGVIGQRDRLSPWDIYEINHAYSRHHSSESSSSESDE